MKCQQNPQCAMFQFGKFSGFCELKSAYASGSLDYNHMTGPAVCNSIKSMLAFSNIYEQLFSVGCPTFLIFVKIHAQKIIKDNPIM